jgi:hypothetical protein
MFTLCLQTPGEADPAGQPVERTSEALWVWAERLQPAMVWLLAAGYLLGRSGGGSV